MVLRLDGVTNDIFEFSRDSGDGFSRETDVDAHNSTSSLLPRLDSTASTTFVDISGMSATIETTGNPVLAIAIGTFYNDTAARGTEFQIEMDGSAVVGAASRYDQNAAEGTVFGSITAMGIEFPEGGEHTFKGQFRSITGGTSSISSGYLVVIEMQGWKSPNE